MGIGHKIVLDAGLEATLATNATDPSPNRSGIASEVSEAPTYTKTCINLEDTKLDMNCADRVDGNGDIVQSLTDLTIAISEAGAKCGKGLVKGACNFSGDVNKIEALLKRSIKDRDKMRIRLIERPRRWRYANYGDD